MDFFEVVRERRSIRKYKDQPVATDTLVQILEAVRQSPSWHNGQCYRFLVISDPAKKEAVLAGIDDVNPGKKAIQQAPIAIVVCADPKESGNVEGKDYYMTDVGIALEHLCLAARALDLGTCWIGWFDEVVLKKGLGIPENMRVVAVTPLGYPEFAPKPRPRKPLTEIVYFDEWSSEQS